MEQNLIIGKAMIYKNIDISEEHKSNITKIIKDNNLTDIYLDNTCIKSIHKGSCNFSKADTYKISTTDMNQLIGLHMIFVYLQNFYGLFGEIKLKFNTLSEDNLTSPKFIEYNNYFEKHFGFSISGIQLFGKSSTGRFIFIAVPKKIYDSRHLFCWDGFNIDLFKLDLNPEQLSILSQHTDLSELKKDRDKLQSLYSFHSDDVAYLKNQEKKYLASLNYLTDSIAKISNAPSDSILSKEDIIFSVHSNLNIIKKLLIKESLTYFMNSYRFKFDVSEITTNLLNTHFSSENIAFEINKTLNGECIFKDEAKVENIKYFLKNRFKNRCYCTNEWNNSITFFQVFDCNKEYLGDFFDKPYLEDILISLDISEFNNVPKTYFSFRNSEVDAISRKCVLSNNIEQFNFKKEIIHPYVKEVEFNNLGKVTFKFINNTLMKDFKELFNL